MTYVLEPHTKIPDSLDYNGKVIKFRKLYNEAKNGLDKHLRNRVNFWDSLEKKYNIDEPGLSVTHQNHDDSSDEETEDINWPKQLWALYLTILFYKNHSEQKKNIEILELELDDKELTDFDEIYVEIMDSKFSASELYEEIGY